MKLAIVGPTRDTVPASFAVDLAKLYALTREYGHPWHDVMIGFTMATYIHVGREWLLEQALRQGAHHILWLDTDMRIPPLTAIRLQEHRRAIVGCNYVTRTEPHRFTAVRGEDAIETTPDSRGLEAVDGMGFGCVLMQTDIVAGLPRPWFQHGRNPQTGADIGEDLMFCRALRAAGHTLYIDHDLSKEIGHIGQQTFTLEHAADYRAPATA